VIPALVGIEISGDKLLLDLRQLVESRRGAIFAVHAADAAQTAR
jgi:hypothetical protein